MISGAERDAEPNVSLAGDGFDAVNDAKDLVEASCPGIVSCADIMAILARDAVVLVRSSHHMLSCFLFLLSSSSRAEGKQYFQKNEREGRGGVEEEVMSFY